MKSISYFRIVAMLLISVLCMSADGCIFDYEEVSQVVKENVTKDDAIKGAKELYKEGKAGVQAAEDAEGSVNKAIAILNTGKEAANTIGNAVPVAKVPAMLIESVLGMVILGLGAFATKKTKEVKVEKKKVADWNQAIEAGMSDGDDKEVIPVSILRDVLDTETKVEFSKTGLHSL